MAISKREIELTQSLVMLQRQYNDMFDYKEGWRRLAQERLDEIRLLQKDIQILANEIDKSNEEARPASMPMKDLSGETAAILLFGE